MTIDTFLMKLATTIINPLIRLMFAAAAIYFIWGVFKYIKDSDSESERQTGSRHILWGLVGMAIMMGVYGILQTFSGLITG